MKEWPVHSEYVPMVALLKTGLGLFEKSAIQDRDDFKKNRSGMIFAMQ